MGEADSRNYQGRFLSDDYTMGDLIKNSNAREASRLKESELRNQIREEYEKDELKKHLNSWLESNNNALSYMHLFGKDFNEGKNYYEKHGMLYEHSASELESIRLRNYLNEYVSDEQRMSLRAEYEKIMKAPTSDWKSQLLKHHMLTNTDKMNKFGQENEAEIAAQLEVIEEQKREEEEKCEGAWNSFKCGLSDAADWIGGALGTAGGVLEEVPHFGNQISATSQAYSEIKGHHQALGEKIRDSGKVGKAFYDAGDFVHEKTLEFTIAKATGPLNVVVTPDEIHQIVTGTSIEDQSLMGTGEVVAGFVVPGADAALLAHEAVQAHKAQEEAAKQNNILSAIDQEYGSDNEEETQPPMRLIREPQHSSKPKGPSNYKYKPPTVERDEIIKEAAPQEPTTGVKGDESPMRLIRPTQHSSKPKTKSNKPTPVQRSQVIKETSQTCKPPRKPIPACN